MKSRMAGLPTVNNRAVELYGTDPRGLEMADYSKAIRLLKPDGAIYPTEELPVSLALLLGEAVLDRELMIEYPDGKRIVLTASAAPMFDETGKVIGAVGVFR